MRNPHQIILEENGLEVLHLFRDCERLQLRASNCKNHRIFTCRHIHKELVPVSIKLKTTLRTDKVKKIIKNAERHLLQGRVKAINSILDNIGKQTEICRSRLASILSAQIFRKCQGFIEKVGEIRFNKVKHRQVNKFNNLLRKEGNITGVSTQLTTFSSSQAGRQAGTFPPSWEQCYFPGSQHSTPGRKQFNGFPNRQVPNFPGRVLIPRKLVPPLTTLLLGKALPRQVILPQLRQAGRQLSAQQGAGSPRPPKGIALLLRQVALAPGKAPTPFPPIGFPKGLPQKNLTLSGSLTYPANL